MCEGLCALVLWLIEVRHVLLVGGATYRSALGYVLLHMSMCVWKYEKVWKYHSIFKFTKILRAKVREGNAV